MCGWPQDMGTTLRQNHPRPPRVLTLWLCCASRAGISPRKKVALALKTCESLHT